MSLRFTAILHKRLVKAADADRSGKSLGGALATAVLIEDAARACRLACEAASVPPGHTPLNIVSPDSTFDWSEAAIHEFYGRVPSFNRQLTPRETLVTWARAEEVLNFRAGSLWD